MNRRHQETFRRYLRKVALGNPNAISDEELLRRFTEQHDDAAFEVVVQRYGPLVQRICRQAMRGTDGADDIFQATFLLLAKKAGTVKKNALGPWLHGVAVRLAGNARRSA